ncbi:hypothetical protein [Pseudonocardia sp. ICBG601]|uniref:hypothetical protein n=1 Tax=Pseudonocardia sp. ICBG601 TaxID=2846759 RepID=UPI001CF67794|nr:hypothetical protein [Pseudonocardia sp. ICBG601]
MVHFAQLMYSLAWWLWLIVLRTVALLSPSRVYVNVVIFPSLAIRAGRTSRVLPWLSMMDVWVPSVANFAALSVTTPVESFTLLKLNVGAADWLIPAGVLAGCGVSAAAIPLAEPIAMAAMNAAVSLFQPVCTGQTAADQRAGLAPGIEPAPGRSQDTFQSFSAALTRCLQRR